MTDLVNRFRRSHVENIQPIIVREFLLDSGLTSETIHQPASSIYVDKTSNGIAIAHFNSPNPADDCGILIDAGFVARSVIECVRLEAPAQIGKKIRLAFLNGADIIPSDTEYRQLFLRQGDPGVTSTVAGLPASSTAFVCFDLGPNYSDYRTAIVCIYMAVPATTGSFNVWNIDAPTAVMPPTNDPNALYLPRINEQLVNTGTSHTLNTGTNNVGQFTLRGKRFVCVRVNNTDAVNAFGAGSYVTLGAM